MKKVYEASTALEAHMIKNLLESEGIDSRVDGEYLQGGVGELQAIGIVRVVVEESDYDAAKNIIDQWESRQVTSGVESDVKSRKGSGAVSGFTLGVILTAGIAYWIFHSPVTTDGIDYDSDGFLDEKWIYRSNRIAEIQMDRNRDRKYDFFSLYDTKGILKSAQADDDFDGVFETDITYREGNIELEDSDKNQNGVKDYKMYYKYGVLDYVVFIDEYTGKVKKRQHFQKGKLVSADYDSDGDSKFDVHYEYDVYEERK